MMKAAILATKLLLAASLLPAAGSGTSIEITLAPNSTFESGSVVDASNDTVRTHDVVVADPLVAIRPEAASLKLNGVEIVGYARLSPMASGFRALVDLTDMSHPHLDLSEPSNDLRFMAIDARGNVYRGEWTINVDAGARVAKLSGKRAELAPAVERKRTDRPVIQITAPPTVARAAGSKKNMEAVIQAELSDTVGLKSVAIHVNGKEIEFIQMRNGFPSRRRGKFRNSRPLPGTVTGGGRHLVMNVPVPLPKQANFVRISATNLDGYDSFESLQIVRPK